MPRSLFLTFVVFVPVFFAVLFWGNYQVRAQMKTRLKTMENPLVLELFTSQSCSSCPPADALLQELQNTNENIYALSCNVDYWNHLSWEDTLSHDFCTARQRSYSRNGRIFTPELAVNGLGGTVGSRPGAVFSQLKAAEGQLKEIGLKKQGQTLTVSLPEGVKGQVFSLFYGQTHLENITRGENVGRKVLYTNPVVKIQQIEGTHFSLEDTPKGAAGVVVVVQERNQGQRKMHAAGRYLF